MPEVSPLDQQTLNVYRAVLFHKEHDPHKLARLVRSDSDAVKAAIARLTELSLLAPSRDTPGALRAVDPSLGMKVLFQREQDELAWRKHRIEQNRVALAALAAEYMAESRTGSADGTEQLDGIDDIRNCLESLTESCQRELLAFHTAGGPAEKSIEATRPLNERALARAVRSRSIFIHSITRDRATRAHAQWMAAHDCEIRTAPSLPMRLLIADTTAALVSGLPGQKATSALLFRSRPVVLAMRALFDAYWDHASPFDQAASSREAEPGELTPQERKLLQLLATGLTDDAVARALGIGVRTERRMVAELMERLRASSRFEAGVRASRRQWI
ncbi:LuxR C-terminal-related transcriptional regulator [Streptomyces sp. TS71-3]|uniref:helix-turn-helix transcriptional regulator n=1 Tax=Streptomyces sp. TS71-3 TaxID=2733862 RepID=UPI001B13297F|nr:LuxR C-terminal-related transcriptional regulator [Streptomyces sp. TS71-3]GHJ36768.1 hypothetical protein Sm713_23770 [Streptomyces sp. TS71-3]